MRNMKCYMNNSSVHGLKYIIDEEAHWLERLFWIFVCISCVYGTVTVFMSSWRSFKDNPVSFVVETTYLDWNTTFPAVTVCEKRSADKIELFSEKFFGTDRNLNLDTYVGDVAFFSGICSSCVYHCGTDIDCPDNLTFFTQRVKVHSAAIPRWDDVAPRGATWRRYLQGNEILIVMWIGEKTGHTATPPSPDAPHREADSQRDEDGSGGRDKAHQFPSSGASRTLRATCKDILKDCRWNDEDFDCCEEFEVIDTGFGECFTINSMQGRRWWQENKTISLTSNRLTGPGVLTFSSQEDIKVAIHSPEDILFNHGSPDQFAIVEYGQTLDMKFQVVEIVNDNNVRDISVKSRNCRFPDENPLKDYPYYSYSACITECEGRAQMELCGCIHHLMPKSSLSRNPMCNVSGLICISNHKENLKALRNTWSDKPGLLCDCPSSCIEQEFKVLQSQIEDLDYPEEERNSTVEDMDYSLRVTIAMASLPTERLSRNVVRTRLDIVVSLGGTAGLFLGASLLSIVELAYYLFIRRGDKERQHPVKQQLRRKMQLARQRKLYSMRIVHSEAFLW